MFLQATIGSPVGDLRLEASERGVRRVHFANPLNPRDVCGDADLPEPLASLAAQLREYFAGRRRTFDVPLELSGTPFQRAVWEELCRIPYGQTISYRELAGRIGKPAAVRAVGLANGANPIPILVPCHRVIGADGTLVGYGGGLDRKRYLLTLEGYPLAERRRSRGVGPLFEPLPAAEIAGRSH